MVGFLLFILASILKWIFAPFLYVFGCIISICQGKGHFDKYNKNLAIAKDQYGNALGGPVFNKVLIKDNGYKYGNPDETISSATGKNKIKGTFRPIGSFLDYCLEKAEPNHSIKSIDNSENEETA